MDLFFLCVVVREMHDVCVRYIFFHACVDGVGEGIKGSEYKRRQMILMFSIFS